MIADIIVSFLVSFRSHCVKLSTALCILALTFACVFPGSAKATAPAYFVEVSFPNITSGWGLNLQAPVRPLLNEVGMVAGTDTSMGAGALWGEGYLYDGTMNRFRPVNGWVTVVDLNDMGNIVGSLQIPSISAWPPSAFLYERHNYSLYDLNDITVGVPSGYVLTGAIDINNRNQILAWAQCVSCDLVRFTNYTERLLFLSPVTSPDVSPVPEVAIWEILLLGLLLVILVLKSRK